MSNNVVDASFLDVLLALKQNVMKDLSVAELAVVTRIDNDIYVCQSFTNTNDTIQCVALIETNVNVNDVVLIVFTNTDFRVNLSKVKAGQPIQTMTNTVYHSKNYGVIIGTVYKKENN